MVTFLILLACGASFFIGMFVATVIIEGFIKKALEEQKLANEIHVRLDSINDIGEEALINKVGAHILKCGGMTNGSNK